MTKDNMEAQGGGVDNSRKINVVQGLKMGRK